MGISHKGYTFVPRHIAQRIGHLSKIGALELAYSLAGRLAQVEDNAKAPAAVYEVLRSEWETVAHHRGDRPLPPLDESE